MEPTETLSPDAARLLACTQGKLDLSKINELPSLAALEISRHEGVLNLNGLDTLSDSAARHLGNHRGALWLLRVKNLSDCAADSLAGHDGPVRLSPLVHASLSPTSRALLRDHRLKQAAKVGIAALPPGGPPIPFQSDAPHGKWHLIYRPSFLEDPVPISVWWYHEAEPPPVELPDWFQSILPDLDSHVHHAYRETADVVATTPLYLMAVDILIAREKVLSACLSICDADATFWEAHFGAHLFPAGQEPGVDCWGGNHYQSADFLLGLPIHHSMHDADLPDLTHWT
jgi:hypothetical protein